MCWWWFAPLLCGLAINFIARGYRADRPLLMAGGFILVVLLGLCISMINRNRGMHIDARIKSLEILQPPAPS
jgi:hypothetical protein